MKKALIALIFIINLLGVAGFWLWNAAQEPWTHQLQADAPGLLIALGRLAGLLAAFLVLLQLFFVGRIRWVESAFGLDHLTRAHHFNGFLIMALLILHAPLLILGNAMMGEVSLAAQGMDFIQNWAGVGMAALAGALFVMIVLLSVAIVKNRMKYEWWHSIHMLAYAAILLAMSHQFKVGGDLAGHPVFSAYWLGLYLLTGIHLAWFRIVRPWVVFYKHRFYVDRVAQETGDVVSIYIKGRHLDRFPVEAGQFMIVRFWARSFRWQAHPFSLSCPPNGDYLRISVKQSGDFTRQAAHVPVRTPVIIDGPYGVFTGRKSSRRKVLMIAGGIGITPLRSMLEGMLAQGKDMVLIYGNRRKRDVVFQEELAEKVRAGGLKTFYVFSEDAGAGDEKGYVDRERIERLAPDARMRDVFLCGPPLMMRKVVKALLALGLRRGQIYYERFSL